MNNTTTSTKSYDGAHDSIGSLMREFDAERVTMTERRHASFRSAQQRVQTARGISFATKIGFGLGILIVILGVAL